MTSLSKLYWKGKSIKEIADETGIHIFVVDKFVSDMDNFIIDSACGLIGKGEVQNESE